MKPTSENIWISPLPRNQFPLNFPLHIKVIPGSKQECIVGWQQNLLKIKVRHPPEKGKANQAVIALIATSLGIAESELSIHRGHTSPLKTILIEGFSLTQVLEKIPSHYKKNDLDL